MAAAGAIGVAGQGVVRVAVYLEDGAECTPKEVDYLAKEQAVLAWSGAQLCSEFVERGTSTRIDVGRSTLRNRWSLSAAAPDSTASSPAVAGLWTKRLSNDQSAFRYTGVHLSAD